MSYGSARDLPSMRAMDSQLKAMRVVGLLLPKNARAQMKDLREQIDRLTSTVDAFYELLGSRMWIFHGDLHLDDMAEINARYANDPEGAERALISWYQGEGRIEWMTRRLNAFPALRARMELLRFAVEDYRAGRFYAVVQVLLSVMDGFVNDLNPANRKGLHALDSSDVDAWDSVVGHHLGLTHAHRTFTKSFKARSDEPVVELYRNGIVHGMLINYNNEIVATKAWNRLFAVADWAKSLEALAAEAVKPPAPTISSVLGQLRDNAETKAALDAFAPFVLESSDVGFEDHGAVQAARSFLDAWSRDNYGAMAQGVWSKVFGGAGPREVRNEYAGHALQQYRLLKVDQSGACVSMITAELEVDGERYSPTLRLVREDTNGELAMPNKPGAWRIVWWTFHQMARNGE